MSSLTSRMGLKRPETTDDFLTEDFYDLLTLLDQYPGIYICTEPANPTWGGAQNGMFFMETDTDLLWTWDGTQKVRFAPLGLLGLAQISADFSTASTSPATAISVGVTVPETTAGSTTKRVKVSASFYAAYNGTSTTLGACEISLRRDPGDVALGTFMWRGRPHTATSPLDWGPGGTIEAYDSPSAGAATYKLSINSIAAVGGTSVINATASNKATLTVTEVGT